MEQLPITNPANVNRTETVGREYLRKSIELCQEYGVPILLTAIPFAGSEEEMQYMNSVYEMAEEYGVPFLDGFTEDVVMPQTDFWIQHI